MLRIILRIAILTYLCIALGGCHIGRTPIYLTVSNDINTPLFFKLYELSNRSNINTSAMLNLWRDDQGQLGNTLINTHACMLYPKQHLLKLITLSHHTKLICAVGFYRNPHQTHWHDCIHLNFSQHFLAKPIHLIIQASGIYFFD